MNLEKTKVDTKDRLFEKWVHNIYERNLKNEN